MAAIGNIRKHSGLLIIVIGVALAAFVLGDISKTQTRGMNNLGEVNGEEISSRDFNNRVEETMQAQKQQQGKQTLTPTETFYIREQTWNQYVNEILLQEEFDDLGLAISPDELAELLHGSNPHYLVRQYFVDPQTGVYNPNNVLELLRNLNKMDQAQRKQYYDFEQAIIKDQMNQKFMNLIRKSYYVPESLAQRMADNGSLAASVKLLVKDIASVNTTEVEVSDNDLKTYYNKNIEAYKLEEETRSVDYVVFEVVPSVNDRTETTNFVNEIFEEFRAAEDPITFVNSVSDHRYDSTFYSIDELPVHVAKYIENVKVGEFFRPYLDNEVYYMACLMDVQFRPDSMLASHVLIAYDDAIRSSATRTKNEAKQLADSLFNVIKLTPSKLPAMAIDFSDDPSAKTNSGDLDWFAEGNMIPEFNNAVLNAAVGEVLLVETAFGFHIIEVNGKKNITKKYRLAMIDRAIEASSQTYQDYWTMASKFAAENTDYESFTKAVNELGLNKRVFAGMTRMTSSIYDLEYPRQIVRWAFNDESKEGSISPIFDFEGKYVIAIVTDIQKEGYRDFESVKGEIEPIVIKEKKKEHLMAQISGLNDFNKISEKLVAIPETLDVHYNMGVIGTHGLELDVVGAIFGMKPGEILKLQGEKGVYVVQFVELKTPESTANLDQIKTQLASNFTNRIYRNAVMNALKGVADIQDDRHLFY